MRPHLGSGLWLGRDSRISELLLRHALVPPPQEHAQQQSTQREGEQHGEDDGGGCASGEAVIVIVLPSVSVVTSISISVTGKAAPSISILCIFFFRGFRCFRGADDVDGPVGRGVCWPRDELLVLRLRPEEQMM